VRLRKVLGLELKRGCDDRAVIGGIDRFLANAVTEAPVAALLAAAPGLPDAGYASLRPAARARWLRALLETQPARKRAAKGAAAGPPAARRPPVTPKPLPPRDPLDAPVTAVRGVKGALQAKLAKLDLHTVRDLVFLLPNRHNDFADVRSVAELQPFQEQTAVVSVWSAAKVRLGYREGTQAVVGDNSGTMRVVWFNQPYLADQLKVNDRVVLSGKVSLFNRLKTMESPEWERLEDDGDLTHTGRLVPVYPLTQGLSQRVLRRAVKEALDRYLPALRETLPAALRERHGLPPLQQALRQVHYPDGWQQQETARRRLAFDELLCVQLVVLGRRQAWLEGHAPAFRPDGALADYRRSLPFSLTGAQERVLGEVLRDLGTTKPMARLLQGDVGSGKTAVAAAALVLAAANGYQGALMAPTEILAEQHFRTLTRLLEGVSVDGRPLRVELLTGSLKAGSKRAAAAALAAGEVDVAVGTQALIQEGVMFRRLGLAVVDEQHRFGVVQRATLRSRALDGNQAPHLLVMSATPIPRTLALTLFGDLEASVIDEMPPGREPVETHWVAPEDRREAYEFVRAQVHEGRQAFVVCPLIEESAAVQTRAATLEYERLARDVFPDLRVGLLHGRVSAPEKDRVLASFRDRELDILVSTTVIEVGIDIPNATVMVIEGADRFGLAQMHQLRGRVGRGGGRSYCLLLSDDPSYTARQRLKLLEELSDGFALAEADLRLRGPGDYFGTRQSGLPEFQAADFSDVRLVEAARQEAALLLQEDPELRSEQHAALAEAVARTKRKVIGEVS
jgi:ATP-dependent DNA helicase RecG